MEGQTNESFQPLKNTDKKDVQCLVYIIAISMHNQCHLWKIIVTDF